MQIVALVISIAVHIGLLYMLGSGGGNGKDGDKDGTPGTVKIKLLDKPAPTESKKLEEKVPETKSNIVIPKKKELPPEQKVVDHKCEKWYEGIGVQHGPNCTIDYIAKGYPADRAGLRIGDRTGPLTETGDCPGRGPLGSFLNLRVIRDGKVLYFKLVREKICTSPEE